MAPVAPDGVKEMKSPSCTSRATPATAGASLAPEPATPTGMLSAPMLAQAFTPGVLNDGGHTSYGFGWMIGTHHGVKRLSHTGSTIGFRTSIQRYPEKKLTVAVLVNREGASPWDIADRIADIYLAGK